MSRQETPEEQRKDFTSTLIVSNFATPDFAVILSEARKSHLLLLCNQFIGR
jgi:hypothetical protein